MKNKNSLLRKLPKVDETLHKLEPFIKAHAIAPLLAKRCVQKTIECKRSEVLNEELERLPESTAEWLQLFETALLKMNDFNLRRVFNGTGIVVHTNLGRSLLPEHTTRQLALASTHYTNLEFNLSTGKRGSRYSLVEDLLCDLCGAEAALVVNNNAAAVLICLDTLANGGEVIVSRGQLVEIGGSFRIPDVMKKSGAKLVEVGATNRTHRYDYEHAISGQTSLLLRVHTSNFRLIGFTSQVSAEELVELGKKHQLPVMEDLGSGSLVDLSVCGLPSEPTVQEVVKSGVDVVTFSGDKLLGGPQAGILAGRGDLVAKVRRHPLMRAMRVDKLTYAALEATLGEYVAGRASRTIPILGMILATPDAVMERAQHVAERARAGVLDVDVRPGRSAVGGGTTPGLELPTWVVALRHPTRSADWLDGWLRRQEVPVVGRIDSDWLLLDLRTALPGEDDLVAETLASVP
jgi:L-seryl-tRNA(Ser) seleniumtransferase